MRVTYQLVGGGDIKLKHAFNKHIWMSWVYHELMETQRNRSYCFSSLVPTTCC